MKQDNEKFIDTVAEIWKLMFIEKTGSPDVFIQTLIEKVYGHRVKIEELVFLIESSPLHNEKPDFETSIIRVSPAISWWVDNMDLGQIADIEANYEDEIGDVND